MFRVLFLTLTLFCTFTHAKSVGLEHAGVMVTTTLNNIEKHYVVKRNIPQECKQVPITNEILWTANFAHPSVPDVCKSTFVHTKGKILPMQLEPGLETYGEYEVLSFLRDMQHNKNLLLIDSRAKDWFKYRTIPGAINIPFIYFKEPESFPFHFEYALKHLGVFTEKNGTLDFSDAKILVLFCNGPWCTQSPSMFFALIKIGYPVEKLKWYRGGMQDWLGAGMTSTRDAVLNEEHPEK